VPERRQIQIVWKWRKISSVVLFNLLNGTAKSSVSDGIISAALVVSCTATRDYRGRRGAVSEF